MWGAGRIIYLLLSLITWFILSDDNRGDLMSLFNNIKYVLSVMSRDRGCRFHLCVCVCV